MTFRPHEKFAPRIVLGTQVDKREPFILTGKPLKDHKFISGLTGMGKSRLIASMCVQLLNENIAFALCDPHDLADEVLTELIALGFFTSDKAYERLKFFDFSRRDAFPAFNVLKQPYPSDMVALNIMESFRRSWSSLSDGNAINIESVIRAGATVLIHNNQPLTALPKLLTDTLYRDAMLANCTDDSVIDWFRDQYTARPSALINSTLKRLFVLTYSPALRYSLGQKDNILNFRYLMDNGISCIYNLGGLDSETLRLLGCLIVSGYEQAALSRANLAEEKRRQAQLFIDEFSQFVSGDGKEFENILTLTRKYGLTLNLACQTLSQTKEVIDALQNALWITLKLGVKDAGVVAPYFVEGKKKIGFLEEFFGMGAKEPKTKAEWAQDIKSLDPQYCYIHLGGSTFHLKTLAMPDRTLPKNALIDVKKRYAQQLLTPLTEIEKTSKRHLTLVPKEQKAHGDGDERKDASPIVPTLPRDNPVKKRARRFVEVDDAT